MVSRRSALSGGATAMALLLSGCGAGRKVAARAADAAADVPGVASASLEQSQGANFEKLLHGQVVLDASDRATGMAVFDEAMRAIITVIHKELDAPTASGMRVGGIMGLLADGQELTALALGPDMPVEEPRLDRVTAGAFFEKYGVT